MKINDLIAGLIKAREGLNGDDIDVIIWSDTSSKNFVIKPMKHTNDIIIDTSTK